MIISENITGSESNTEFIIEIDNNNYRLELFEDYYFFDERYFNSERYNEHEREFDVVRIYSYISCKYIYEKKPMTFIKKNFEEIVSQIEYQLEEQPFSLL